MVFGFFCARGADVKSLETKDLEALEEILDILTRLRENRQFSYEKNLWDLRGACLIFQKKLLRHIEVQEKVVFPFLEVHIPKLEPAIHVLKGEHTMSKEKFRHLILDALRMAEEEGREKTGFLERLSGAATSASFFLRRHLELEGMTIQKAMTRHLRRDEHQELASHLATYGMYTQLKGGPHVE